jgi:RNase H-fold protein (predicted Holliday junction resolvase)
VERDLRGKKRKESDSLAAQLLLQEYLDFLKEKI